eukprot:GHVR01118623.1.p1 GENE.GHVR01118623.1~~GHVR01118623.1.p1  ORF type:complete len:109 (+),score=16.60 GHVR01118623.1:380-706(+)
MLIDIYTYIYIFFFTYYYCYLFYGRRDLRRSPEKEDKSSESGDGEDEDAELPEEQLMAKLMGFGDFTTSKGQDHSGSAVEHVNKKTDRMYRQYMNRKGGFNRPLDAVR